MQYNTNKSQGGGSSPPFHNENIFVVARSGRSLIQDLKLEPSLGLHDLYSSNEADWSSKLCDKNVWKWMEGNSGSNFRPQMAVYSLLFAHNTYFCPGQNNIMIHVYTTTTT